MRLCVSAEAEEGWLTLCGEVGTVTSTAARRRGPAYLPAYLDQCLAPFIIHKYLQVLAGTHRCYYLSVLTGNLRYFEVQLPTAGIVGLFPPYLAAPA